VLYNFLSWCPGALGLFLRQKLYPRYLKECGSNVLFGRFIKLGNGKDTITIGSNVVVNDSVVFQCCSEENAKPALIIEDNVFVGSGSIINLTCGDIIIKCGSNLGSSCNIQSDNTINIGEKVLAAAYCEIGKSDSHYLKKPGKETRIGRGCWLGVRAKILAGTQIGPGTIIGAHATVTKDIPGYVTAIDSPAVILRQR